MKMRCPGMDKLSVVVLGLTMLMFGSCIAQQLYSINSMNGYYGEPVYDTSVRRPRSILQNFAVDRMLKDNGFVRSIINCVLDKGPCESNGRKLRLMAPEILRGQCPGCSRTVHNQIRRVISHVQRNFPVEWSEVTRRFMSYNNPSGQDFGPHAPHGSFSPPQGGGFAPPQGDFSPPHGDFSPQHQSIPQQQHGQISSPHGALSPPHQPQHAPPQVQQPPNLPTSYNPDSNEMYQSNVYG